MLGSMAVWRPLRQSAMLTLVALAAVGCHRFEPAPLSPAETAAALERRSLADPSLRAVMERTLPGGVARWPLTAWGVDALTVAALHFQPGLAVARAQWRVAEAGVLTAGRRPNPVLSVTPQYVANSPAGIAPWDVTSALDWPIETAGKRGFRIDHAEHLATSARLALHAAAWRVRADVRARLLDFVAAGARTARLVAESAVQREVVTLLEDRLRAGAASVAEVAPARVAALQLATDLADAERQRSDARVRLATAVGVPVRALDGLELVLPLDGDPPEVERPANELRRDALQGRADVLAALADYAASESAIRLEIARQYPDLRIGPGYEYDQGLNKWAVVGVSLELPVLDRNQGPIGEAEARRTEAAARFTEVQASVIGDLDRAIANRDAARDALARAESLYAAERERARATRQAFQAGAVDALALRAARLTSIRAALVRLDAQVRLQQALGDLEAAVQPPLPVVGAVERYDGPPGEQGEP
jgi:cobalt-zinc-cadmium efflux system outer membrane protein